MKGSANRARKLWISSHVVLVERLFYAMLFSLCTVAFKYFETLPAIRLLSLAYSVLTFFEATVHVYLNEYSVN